MAKKELKKAFIWYGLRISFWVMILFWIIATLLDSFYETDAGFIFSVFWIVIAIFTFVVSIIYLTKYKKKAFAIVTLVFSSILILLFFVGFMGYFTSPTGEVLFNETQEFIAEGYYDSYKFDIYDYVYLNIDFDSDNLSNVYLLGQNEFFRYENGESFYYTKAGENTNFWSIENEFLSPDTYYVVIETIDNSVRYDVLIESSY